MTADLADDPLHPYRDLRDRDLRERASEGSGHGGRFVVEGEVVLDALLRRSIYRPESLLLLDSRAEKLAPLLAHVPDGVPVHTAPREAMDGIVGFPMHRGVLAMGLRGAPRAPAAVLGTGTAVICEGLANHDNIGAVFRNAAAFGAVSVLLDDASADPLYRKAIRVSAGAALSVPFARAPIHDLLDAAEAAGHTLLALDPRGDEDVVALEPVDRPALVLGAEGPGLGEAVRRRCRLVRIGMAPGAVARGFDSINVATSCGIALHALARR